MLAACSDHDPTGAVTAPVPAPASLTRVECTASVSDGALSCDVPPAAGGASRDLTVGGQNTYVRLVSRNVSYDGSAEFRADVTVQNLLDQVMGTADGTTVSGVRVFFTSEPVTTSGTGSVVVGNRDGNLTVTGGEPQPYFHYNQILEPRGTSASRLWLFTVPSTVSTFRFSVYVQAPLPAEQGVLRWTRVENVATTAVELTAASAGERDVIAVGRAGTIVHHDGATWANMESPTRLALYGAWRNAAGTVFAVGDSGVVASYGGNRWSVIRPGTAAGSLRAVGGWLDHQLIAVGTLYNAAAGRNQGWIMRSFDRGATWTEQRFSDPDELNGVHMEGEHALVVGSTRNATTGAREGVVYDTKHYGGAWMRDVLPGTGGDRELRGAYSAGLVSVVVGREVVGGVNRTLILRSTDGARSWTATVGTAPEQRMLTAISGKGNEIFATGVRTNPVTGDDEGIVLHSVDAGVTWTERLVAGRSDRALSGVAVSPTGTFYMVGRPGLVLRTDGAALREELAPAHDDLRGVAGSAETMVMVGRHANFAAGRYDALTMRSTDGGASWTQRTIAGSYSRDLWDVAVSGNTVVAVGTQSNTATDRSETILLRSTDGGASWTETVRAGAGDVVFQDVASSGSTFIAAGSGIIRSTDGGATWTEVVPATDPRRFRAVWMSGSTVLAAGSSNGVGVLARSDDGGATWSAVPSIGSAERYFGGVWAAGSTIVVVGEQPGADEEWGDAVALRSTDGGATWTAATFPGGVGRPLRSVWGSDAASVYAVGHDGVIFHHDGSAWKPMASGTAVRLEDVWGRSSTDLFVPGYGRTILRGTR